ncbi:thiazole biosynthesis protein ThiJ [Bacteroidales bacterium]|nr:thiazole biosynthesis protein ThiJ [Bacteroidales bacterium]
MKQVFIFLIDGFEEIEAIATIDILRRADINIQSVSLTGNNLVVGAHKVGITCDLLFEEAAYLQAQLLIIPGGTVKFNEHEALKKELLAFYATGKTIAAICAAPAVLGGLGLLKGKNATCYPGFESYLEGANFQDQAVVVDGNIITAKGPGLTMDFALKIVEVLEGKAKSKAVAADLLL